jgi:phosphopantetheinyl transferase
VKLTGEGLTRNLNSISLATHEINDKHVYTKVKVLPLYKNINFAIASYKPLPKLIPLKRIVI